MEKTLTQKEHADIIIQFANRHKNAILIQQFGETIFLEKSKIDEFVKMIREVGNNG